MRTKEVTQKDLEKLTKTNLGKISRAIAGYQPVNADLAKKIYQALGADPSLDFLINYEGIAQRSESESTGWDRVYDEGVQILKEVYDIQTPERKGAIRGELEQLAEKYKSK